MNDLLKYLANKIDEDLKNIEADLATGVAKDHGDYKFHCGRYRGLLTAKSHIIEAAEKAEREREIGSMAAKRKRAAQAALVPIEPRAAAMPAGVPLLRISTRVPANFVSKAFL